jgi:hypothetical protein
MLSESQSQAGQVVHTCNTSTWRLRQKDLELEAILCYIGRACLRKEGRKGGREGGSEGR